MLLSSTNLGSEPLFPQVMERCLIQSKAALGINDRQVWNICVKANYDMV